MDLSRLKTTRTIANLKAGRNDWYRIVKNQADPSRTSVSIYDEIGWFGVTATDFIDELKNISGPIDLHLNSPGGEVWDGIAIHAYLVDRGNVTTYVDSLAASIASVIAMAGTEIVMGRNASLMIHDGFGMVVGNAADMREQADLLDRVSDNIASIYADRTGKPVADWRAAMLAETWYIGQEAVDAGLADRLAASGAAPGKSKPAENEPNEPDEDDQPGKQMAAHFDLSVFRNVPGPLRNQAEPTVPDPTAPPPEPTPPDEAPADADRGIVVPEPAVQGEGKPAPEPEALPTEQKAGIELAGANDGEFLAWLRQNIRFQRPDPLGTDTMPLLNKAIPVHHTATVDTPWDGPATVAAMPAEYADLHYCHAWQSADADASSHTKGDDDADDKKGSYRFPHHAKDGGPANLAACRNGLARLENSKIPDADKPGAKAHLQAHLDDATGDDKGSGDSKNQSQPSNTFAWDPSMTAAFKEAMQ
jgi:ATP-dependent protease ClpP protease subunit